MSTHRLPLVALLCGLGLALATPRIAQAEAPVVRRVSSVAHENARATLDNRRGGLLRFGWHHTKGALLGGALGAGVALATGQPALGQLAARGVGVGVTVQGLRAHKSGIYGRSERAFARATLADMKGQPLRKHFHKLVGIALSTIEHSLSAGVMSGGLGLAISGPAGAIPSALAGFGLGAVIGAGLATGRAYVMPTLRSFSAGRAISKADRALSRLDREPSNPALQRDAADALSAMRTKADKVSRLSTGKTRRYEAVKAHAAQVGLGSIAAQL